MRAGTRDTLKEDMEHLQNDELRTDTTHINSPFIVHSPDDTALS